MEELCGGEPLWTVHTPLPGLMMYTVAMPNKELQRCEWAKSGLMVQYHDEEWGVPLHDDRKLFEMLVLEGFQAGLSWITILRKRENFRKAFRDFDPEVIVRFKKRDLERLMQDAGIVRNRLKVEGSVLNARAFLAAKDEFGSFDKFIWQFTGGKTLRKPGGLTRQEIAAK